MRKLALALTILAGAAASAAALSPGDLTPEEQGVYATVKSNPAAAQNFLVTREYVRQARAVVGNPAAAASFPAQPKGFSTRYLLAGDKDAINEAVSLSVAAMAKSLWA
jgi:hypothetical protein